MQLAGRLVWSGNRKPASGLRTAGCDRQGGPRQGQEADGQSRRFKRGIAVEGQRPGRELQLSVKGVPLVGEHRDRLGRDVYGVCGRCGCLCGRCGCGGCRLHERGRR